MVEIKTDLIRYGRWLLARQLDEQVFDLGTLTEPVNEARRLLGDLTLHGEAYRPSGAHLASIFACLDSGDRRDLPDIHRQLTTLAIEGQGFFPQPSPAAPSADLWQEFSHRADRMASQYARATDHHFEAFFHLYSWYACNVPAALDVDFERSFDPRGLSLLEQFKATSALACCLGHPQGDTDRLLLIGGDVPGIQAMLYTITSSGAVKSLRGRSLYLQLLSDVIVRLILDRLNLPWTNVVFNAGGNFKVLAPGIADGNLKALRRDINDRLLDIHRGELYVALAWAPLTPRAVADARSPGSGGELARAVELVTAGVEAEKRSWFAAQAAERYAELFGPLGRGGPVVTDQGDRNICAVCHTDVTPDDPQSAHIEREVAEDGTETRITYCQQCWSFEGLAEALGRAEALTITRLAAPYPLAEPYVGPEALGKPPWRLALQALGYDFAFVRGEDPGAGANVVYRLNPNRVDDWLRDGDRPGQGFRFISKLTPWVTDENGKESIRDTTTMANCDSTGLRRYGVLRMDVDGLGDMFHRRLVFQDLLHTSALSAAVSLFFEGHLDPLCRTTAVKWRTEIGEIVKRGSPRKKCPAFGPWDKVPYIIYAGGDDLFIVGCWDVLPALAAAIYDDLERYAGGRLTLSAGITLASARFPIYQAAGQARDALDTAKDRVVRDRRGHEVARKDAITFLGATVSWTELATAWDLAERLARLIMGRLDGAHEGPKAPHALNQLLGYIAGLYQREAAEHVAPDSDEVYLGRWIWRLSYGLQRMAERVDASLRGAVENIAKEVIEPGGVEKARAWQTVRFLGLPARWSEFLIREEE